MLLLWSFAAVVTLPFGRNREILLGILAAGVVLGLVSMIVPRNPLRGPLLPIAVASLGVMLWHLSAPSVAALQRRGAAIAASVERFRVEHGRLPSTLEECGLSDLQTRCGPWQYRHDEARFKVSVGEYGQDGFALYYSSDTGDWHMDR